MPVHHVDTTHHPLVMPDGPADAGSALWVEIRPDLKRSAVIASDILAALGKRRDVAGRGRNANQDIDLAVAWMSAYETTALVATEAQRLTPLLMRQVVTVAARARIPLWLLHRAPRDDAFLQALERHRAHPRHRDEVPAFRTRKPQAGVRPTLGVQLPVTAFHDFRSTCRAALTTAAYRRVEGHFAHTAQHCWNVLARDGCDIDVVARLAEELLHTGPRDDQLVTGIRALQLACWHHDRYLKSDIPTLLASPERQVSDPATVDEALTAYRQPHRAIATMLTQRQVGVADIHALRIRDAHPDGAITLRTGRRVEPGPHTRRAVAAQLKLRAGHNIDDPLLAVTDRAISQALNDANADFGIRVHGRRAERHTHPRRWLHNLGLTLHELS